MLGDNPKRSAISGDGSILYVKNIFRTIQGEGPNAGIGSVFIRLGGCNLACSFCDTEFEDYTEFDLDSVLKTVDRLSLNPEGKKSINLVVITGGEPFRQPINPLCEILLDLGFDVQIETNGTIYREVPKEVDIICSPKVVDGKYLSIRPDLLKRITAFKFLISSKVKSYNLVPELGQSEYNTPVYVQAMDEYDKNINSENEKMVVEMVMNHGYKLSYQIHKKLGIE